MIEMAQVLYREDREDPENATLMVVADGKTFEWPLSEAKTFSILESASESLRKMRKNREKEEEGRKTLIAHLYGWVHGLPVKHPQQIKWRDEARKIADHQ